MTRLSREAETHLMTTVIQSGSINPLMSILREMENHFHYGTIAEDIKILNDLLSLWYEEEGKVGNFSDPNHVSDRIYRVTRLSSFLVSINESFMKLKERQPELAEHLK